MYQDSLFTRVQEVEGKLFQLNGDAIQKMNDADKLDIAHQLKSAASDLWTILDCLIYLIHCYTNHSGVKCSKGCSRNAQFPYKACDIACDASGILLPSAPKREAAVKKKLKEKISEMLKLPKNDNSIPFMDDLVEYLLQYQPRAKKQGDDDGGGNPKGYYFTYQGQLLD